MKSLKLSRKILKRMTAHINKKNIGKLAITLSILVWLADRLTLTVSALLGQIIYGDRYIQTSNSMIADPSCVFNIDMYLTYSLSSVMILGIVLYISSHKRDGVEEF
jgi:hypothetical protein